MNAIVSHNNLKKVLLTVIISLYYKEKGDYFNKAMESIWDNQTLKPNRIILVLDGELTDDLYSLVSFWKNKLGEVLYLIDLKVNKGLAYALNCALEASLNNSKYIARMDTDDISHNQRFAKQIDFLSQNPEVDVVGTWIDEIDENDHIIKNVVKYPLEHFSAYSFFRKRDPLAHPTVMFRSSFFAKAGVYDDSIKLAEDTLLWYSGFLNDCIFANINYTGLSFRRSPDFYKRRANFVKSFKLLKIRIFSINRKLGYDWRADFYAIFYFLFSFSPAFFRKIVYNFFR